MATLAASDYRAPRKSGFRYRRAWSFKDETEAFIAGRMTALEAPAPLLHVCAGASRLPGLRVDLVHPGADVRADGTRLPFRDGSVGTVVMDPPWGADSMAAPGPGKATERGVSARKRLLEEALRVVRQGGLIFVYAPWMPRYLVADLVEAWIREENRIGLPLPPVLLTVWRKAR